MGIDTMGLLLIHRPDPLMDRELSSMLFAGLSGSAVADGSALGSMPIPAMEKEGYTRRFAAAITAANSITGPIIPRWGIMIMQTYVMGESVAALFVAGIVPGV